MSNTPGSAATGADDSAPPAKPAGRLLVVGLVGLMATIVLLVHARHYLPLFVDDGFISLRYARRLLDGHGLTWTEGEAVEGYSNLLWVLGCAGLGALGINLVDAARALGIAGGLAAVWAVVLAFRPATWRSSLPALAGGLLVALAGPVAIWAVGGLEATLFGGLLVCAVVACYPLLEGLTQPQPGAAQPRTLMAASALLASLCLLRPDGPIFTVVACVALVGQSSCRRQASRLAARLALAPIIATLAQTGFRAAYYGDWIPNTARAKIALTETRLLDGLLCIMQAAYWSLPLWLLALGSIGVASTNQRRRPRIVLTWAFFLVWTAYCLFVACDELGYRSLLPSFVVLTLLAAETIAWAMRAQRRLQLGVWLSSACLVGLFGWAQQQDANIHDAAELVPPLSWRGAAIGKTVARAMSAKKPLLAVDSAGAIPYYSKLPTLDMLGLNDRYLARHRPPSMGHGLLGHELGDGDYVLRRRPDLIIPGIPGSTRLSYRGGGQLKADPRFADRYRKLNFQTDPPVRLFFQAWVRQEGRAGVRRTATLIEIPGHLFATTAGTVARFDAQGRLGTEFDFQHPARLSRLRLGPGRWRISTTSGGGDTLSVFVANRIVGHGSGHVELQLDAAQLLDLQLTPAPPPSGFVRSATAQLLP